MRLMLLLAMMFVMFGCGKPHVTPVPDPVPDPNPVPTTSVAKAVLAGINAYPGAPLSGCINDVLEAKAFLLAEGFKEENIILLTDQAATRKAIMEKLEWLVKDAKTGDLRYFHFSGHGTEFAGRDLDKQPDGLNQVICPYDFNWTADTMIMDVDFVDVFKKMPDGVIFNWASDSCHSGDLTRLIPKPNEKIRQYPNIPPDVKQQIEKARKANLKRRGFVGGLLDVGFISGCRYDQTSADAYINGKNCGAMTHFLFESLKANRNNPLTSLVADMNNRLMANGYDQQPQAKGARVSKPFLK